MTNKLMCPFCRAELTKIFCSYACSNNNCPHCATELPVWVWQALIDGKKAQEDLKYVKEELECMNHNYSVLSEQKEIAYQNYLKITGDLQKQLQKAQDTLKGIEIRVFAIRSCVQDGYTQLGERNRNIFIALELFKDLIKEITSITKQEK